MCSFSERAAQLGTVLGDRVAKELRELPALRELAVGAVHIALEAKACMTAFVKARPRLYDELNSSHLAIHGNSRHTIAAGLAMVNMAPEFISPGRNDFDGSVNLRKVGPSRPSQRSTDQFVHAAHVTTSHSANARLRSRRW